MSPFTFWFQAVHALGTSSPRTSRGCLEPLGSGVGDVVGNHFELGVQGGQSRRSCAEKEWPSVKLQKSNRSGQRVPRQIEGCVVHAQQFQVGVGRAVGFDEVGHRSDGVHAGTFEHALVDATGGG